MVIAQPPLIGAVRYLITTVPSPEVTAPGLGAVLAFAEVSEVGGACTLQGAVVDMPSAGPAQPDAKTSLPYPFATLPIAAVANTSLRAAPSSAEATEPYPEDALFNAKATVQYPSHTQSDARR